MSRHSHDKRSRLRRSAATQGQAAPASELHLHGPENAEHELRKAYNLTIEAAMAYLWDRRAIPGVSPDEAVTLYRHAYQRFREGDRLASERWARAAKHLALAFWHEAKIAYLEPRFTDIPFLEGADAEDYELHEHSDTTRDLLDSVADHVPPGISQQPEEMRRHLSRARRHLQILEQPDYNHELLRAERIKAAYEYGRVLECMALAYEAEASRARTAA